MKHCHTPHINVRSGVASAIPPTSTSGPAWPLPYPPHQRPVRRGLCRHCRHCAGNVWEVGWGLHAFGSLGKGISVLGDTNTSFVCIVLKWISTPELILICWPTSALEKNKAFSIPAARMSFTVAVTVWVACAVSWGTRAETQLAASWKSSENVSGGELSER